MDPSPAPTHGNETILERLVAATMLSTLRATRDWPHPARRRLFAGMMARVWAPLLGWPGAIDQTLTLVRPTLTRSERRRLARQAATHAGAGLADLLSPADFAGLLQDTPIMGPGVAAMKTAARAGKGAVLVTAGLGLPDAIMGALAARGLPVARQSASCNLNPLDRRIEHARAALGGTFFPAGDAGLRALEAHVAGGGLGVIRADETDAGGTPVRLFGARVRAPRFPAAIALRTHTDLIPTFALKRPDGGYGIWMAPAIEHAAPDDMLQAFLDSLEGVIGGHMDQFFWAEPRWQPERYLNCAAPSTGP